MYTVEFYSEPAKGWVPYDIDVSLDEAERTIRDMRMLKRCRLVKDDVVIRVYSLAHGAEG